MRNIILLLICFNANICIYPQSNSDSLNIIWNSDEYPDTIRLKVVNTIIWRYYMFSNPDSALILANQQYTLAKSAGDSIRLGDALNNKASAFYYKGFYKEALIYFNMCLSIAKKTNDHQLILGSYMNLSAIYSVIENYEEALYYNEKSFELIEKSKNFFYNKDVLSCYYNKALIYEHKKEFISSINYYNKALSISKEIGDSHHTSLIFGNLGQIFTKQKKHTKALEFFNKKLALSKQLNNQNLIADAYQGVGVSYRNLSKFKLAITNLEKSVALKKQIGTIDLQENYFQLYQAYNSMGNTKMALKMHELFSITQDSLHAKEAEIEGAKIEQIRKFNEIKYRDSIKHIRETLLKKTELKTNRKELKREKIIVDGLIIIGGVILFFLFLLNNRFKKTKKQKATIEEQKIKVENQKKTLEEKNIELKRFSIVVSETDNVIIILDAKGNVEWVNDSFVKLNNLTLEELIIERGKNIATISNNDNMAEYLETCRSSKAPYLYDSLNFTNDGKRVWESSTITPIFDEDGTLSNYIIIDTDITKQKDAEELVRERNKDITDSINYAKRIQSAILPPLKIVKEYLKESFILYKPKDVIAGDFYWLEPKQDRVLFAAADCTGHGVPGALVSIVCNNALNRSVREYELTDPGLILDKTREIVIQEFEKSDMEVRDGMDIAICSLIGDKLEYAGAHNPLWIVRNGEVLVTRANKQPIGLFEDSYPYTTHSFDLEKGDTIYIFSDGYVDQFGGERGKKFKAKAFRELLLSIQDRTMEEQKTHIDKTFETWKGAAEQIDDVCVVGVRI